MSHKTIDSYLAARDPNRVCYPNTPLPLPVNVDATCFQSDSSFCVAVAQANSQILQILHDYNIFGCTHVVPTLQWRFDGPRQPTVTASLTTEAVSSAWLAAAKKIHDLLKSNGVDSQVELINPQRVNSVELLPKCASAEDRKLFDSMQLSLFKILSNYMDGVWLNIGLYMCMEDSSSSEAPYLLVFVQDNSRCNWDAAAAEMTEVLGKRFKLQFRPGRNEALILTSGPLIPLGPDDDGGFREFKPSKALPAERFVPHRREESVGFKPRIHTGASISTSNATNSKGTLGIFVDVKVGPASSHTYGLSPGVHKCVLTCHHNIEPASDSPDYVAAHSSGFPLVFDQDANPSVVYPAITDVTRAIRNLTHNIAADERQLREHHSKGQLFTWKTSSKEELFGLLSQLQANRKSLRDCQNLQKNGPIGRVVLSSGVQPFNKSGCQLEKTDFKRTRTAGLRHPCTAHDHHLKDFALIKLATGTSYANTAPLVRPDGATIPVNRTGTPQIGGRVFKHGCKSGVTAGTIVNRIISSRADIPFYYGTWAVVGEGSVRFSAGGDSGSGVTDESHALVGQVQAGFHNGRTYEVSYMCDIDSIFRDVQEMIPGSEIELSLPNPTMFDSIISNVRYCFLSVGERLRREDDQDLSEC